MKKILLLFMAMVGTMTAQADNYSFLTFEMTDGAKASVAVESLTLTISGTMLTAGSQQFTLSNLSKMYFSTSDERATGIEEITLHGLFARIVGKVSAMTVLQYINYINNKPIGRIKYALI